MASLSDRFSTNRSALTQMGRSIMSAAPSLSPTTASMVLRRVLEVGIDGVARFPGARSAAASAMGKHADAEAAIDALVKQHLALAGAQGFVTNLGGFEMMAITMPANVSGLAIVQTRMVAGIAHLRGYDITDQRVRGAVLMCLIGEKGVQELVDKGELPSPMIVATAPVADQTLHDSIAEKAMGALLANATTKRAGIAVTKKIPIVGGGVGAAADGWSTWTISQYARRQFVSRRR